MWLVMLGLMLTLAMAAASAAAPPAPCADWDNRFQQSLTRATVPEALRRILAVHQDHGFTSHFAEAKHIGLLRHPLRSTGQLVFIPRQGLYRQLNSPFQQEMLITDRAIYQRYASGATETMALAKLPAAKAFVEAFLAVFSGSWDTLHTHFHVYFSAHESGWQLGLKPAHPVMAKVISCLVLDGAQERLLALHVQESNGDVTSDRFSDARILPESQWAAYRDRFHWPPIE
jgi:hypothetical protein